MGEAKRADASHIEVLRVVCIISMIWVHVAPAAPSVINTGDWAMVGTLLADVLGRASVAALSFVSGFLLWKSARAKPFGAVVSSKARTLLLPMIVWGGIYTLMAVGKQMLTGESVAGLGSTFDGPLGFINALTGLAGPTSNYALFFIRDLFVSLLLLRLLSGVIDRAPLPLLAFVFVITIFHLSDPLIFRPSVLLFALMGCIWARRDQTLAAIAGLRFALPVIVLALLGYGLFAWIGTVVSLPPAAREAQNVSLRIALSVFAITVAHGLSRQSFGPAIAGTGKHMYLIYLTHVPVISTLWVAWDRLVGGPMEPSYLVFYLVTPFVAAGLGIMAGQIIDTFPVWLQTPLRGKVKRRPASTPVAAVSDPRTVVRSS